MSWELELRPVRIPAVDPPKVSQPPPTAICKHALVNGGNGRSLDSSSSDGGHTSKPHEISDEIHERCANVVIFRQVRVRITVPACQLEMVRPSTGCSEGPKGGEDIVAER